MSGALRDALHRKDVTEGEALGLALAYLEQAEASLTFKNFAPLELVVLQAFHESLEAALRRSVDEVSGVLSPEYARGVPGLQQGEDRLDALTVEEAATFLWDMYVRALKIADKARDAKQLASLVRASLQGAPDAGGTRVGLEDVARLFVTVESAAQVFGAFVLEEMDALQESETLLMGVRPLSRVRRARALVEKELKVHGEMDVSVAGVPPMF